MAIGACNTRLIFLIRTLNWNFTRFDAIRSQMKSVASYTAADASDDRNNQDWNWWNNWNWYLGDMFIFGKNDLLCKPAATRVKYHFLRNILDSHSPHFRHKMKSMHSKCQSSFHFIHIFRLLIFSWLLQEISW